MSQLPLKIAGYLDNGKLFMYFFSEKGFRVVCNTKRRGMFYLYIDFHKEHKICEIWKRSFNAVGILCHEKFCDISVKVSIYIYIYIYIYKIQRTKTG